VKNWSRRGLAILLVILTVGIVTAGVVLPGVILKSQDTSLLGQVESAGADYYAGQQEVDVGDMTLDQKLLLTSGEWERDEVKLFSSEYFLSESLLKTDQAVVLSEEMYKNGVMTNDQYNEMSREFEEYVRILHEYYGYWTFSSGRVGVYQYTDTYLKKYVCEVFSISFAVILQDYGYDGKVEAVFDVSDGSLLRLCLRIYCDTEFHYFGDGQGDEEIDLALVYSLPMSELAAQNDGDWRDTSEESYVTCPLKMSIPDENASKSRKKAMAISDTCDYVIEYTPKTLQIYYGLRSDANN